MKNPKLNPIATTTPSKTRYPHNFSHDVHTTADFGFVQPLMIKGMEANSKGTISHNVICRCSPLNSPTFARVRMDIQDIFVPVNDLTDNYQNMMVGKPINHGTQTAVPEKMINLDNRYLSANILIGAEMQVYVQSVAKGLDIPIETYGAQFWKPIDASKLIKSDDENTLCLDANDCGIDWDVDIRFKVPDAHNNNRILHYSDIGVMSDGDVTTFIPMFNFRDIPSFGLNHAKCLDLSVLFPSSVDENFQGQSVYIPINFRADQTEGLPVDPYVRADGYEYEGVNAFNADIVIERLYPIEWNNDGVWTDDGTAVRFMYCFRLSDFGKRIRKILLGAKLGINFNDAYPSSFLKLCAYYKAYWDAYHITQHKNWETSPCREMLKTFDYEFLDSLNMYYHNEDYSNASRNSSYWSFIYDLANCYHTNDIDFVSAHLDDVLNRDGIGATIANSTEKIYDETNGTIDDRLYDLNDGSSPKIAGNFNYWDVEALKSAWLSTNQQSIAGMDLEKSLRALGLSDFIEHEKGHSKFIGSDMGILQVSDVTASADTANEDGEGSSLGELAGKGIIKFNTKPKSYETNYFGFWVTLLSITPESGFVQDEDPYNDCISRDDFYQPVWDGKGYELNKVKNVICGSMNYHGIPAHEYDTLERNFGFLPIYSRFKHYSGVVNGDFNLRSTRANLDSYHLERQIDVGEKMISVCQDEDARKDGEVYTLPAFPPYAVPNADSEIYRQPERWKFLGNLERIFKAPFRNIPAVTLSDSSYNLLQILIRTDDEFIMHVTNLFPVRSSMLPIERTFGTIDDDFGANSKITMS